ncbi:MULTISPECIES: hypothetical protein [Sphingobium]|uniref:hypothetical protein n=1 Tax=Sphingobium TaxID=165695 RepID=UPI00159C8131|nr:hypothetical protein [Sphingobium sp. 15-1]
MTSENLSKASVQEQLDQAHYAVHFANRALVKGDWSEPSYVPARKALDDVMLLLSKAKWLLGRVTGTLAGYEDPFESLEEEAYALKEASALFNQASDRAKEIQQCLETGASLPLFALPGTLDSQGTETLFYDGVPIVPSINPIVVLKGSNHEMGRQYAEQVLDIYGPFIFQWHGRRQFSAENLAEIGKWEAELRQHMPEILDFARGWAEGATGRGVAMDHMQALAIWTGVNPPAKATELMEDAGLFNAEKSLEALRPADRNDMCSGVGAWGDATTDGELVFAATQDQDCTFEATIIAFPDEGNSFIYTPFAANGSLPVMGPHFMAGHPGMNNKGLAYIHHGGAGGTEAPTEWGYGIRRGPMTFHILQYANSAKEALGKILTYPVGDLGVVLGSVGGFWADASYGFSLEGRPGAPNPPSPIIREVTYGRDGKTYNFLYANNNSISPLSGSANGAPSQALGGYQYELEAGWYTADPKLIDADGFAKSMWRRAARCSAARNRYQHRMILAGYGRVDLDYMTMMYRQSGELPSGSFEEIAARYRAGEEWNVSTGHRMNAFTVVAKPDHGDRGVYRGCIGPANRAVHAKDPGHGYYYHDETAAFWEVTLAKDPEAVCSQARELADRKIAAARKTLATVDAQGFAGYAQLESYLSEAAKALQDGSEVEANAPALAGDARWAAIARAVRLFTRAQVRACQVHEAIEKPADKPEMLAYEIAAE